MGKPTIGLWTLSLDGLTLPDVSATVREVDEQGWASLWFGEADGRDAFSTACLALAATERIHIGTGIANIWARDAFASAAASRTLHAAHPGRFTLGLGVSHRSLVTDLRGHDYAKPLAAMRAYITALRDAPSRVPGESELPPVVLAALGPKMTELAGQLCHGAVSYLTTPSHTAQARERVGPHARLVVEQAAVVTSDCDEQEWRRRSDQHLRGYLALDNYRRSFERGGLTVPALGATADDDFRSALVPYGMAATSRRIDEHFKAGADEVIIQVLGGERGRAPMADWAACARALL